MGGEGGKEFVLYFSFFHTQLHEVFYSLFFRFSFCLFFLGGVGGGAYFVYGGFLLLLFFFIFLQFVYFFLILLLLLVGFLFLSVFVYL